MKFETACKTIYKAVITECRDNVVAVCGNQAIFFNQDEAEYVNLNYLDESQQKYGYEAIWFFLDEFNALEEKSIENIFATNFNTLGLAKRTRKATEEMMNKAALVMKLKPADDISVCLMKENGELVPYEG